MFTLPFGLLATPVTTARFTANTNSSSGTRAAVTNPANMYDANTGSFGTLYAGTDLSGLAFAEVILKTAPAGIPSQYINLQVLADFSLTSSNHPNSFLMSFDNGTTFPLDLTSSFLPYLGGGLASISISINKILVTNVNLIQLKMRTGNTAFVSGSQIDVYDTSIVYA